MNTFNMDELAASHRQYKLDLLSKIRKDIQDDIKTKKLDTKKCFESIKEYYAKHGRFPGHYVHFTPECMGTQRYSNLSFEDRIFLNQKNGENGIKIVDDDRNSFVYLTEKYFMQ
jgi:hypothetical protein